MHEKALFSSDLLKAREIMGEDRPWELRRLGREVRGPNEGELRRRAPNVVYKGNMAKFILIYNRFIVRKCLVYSKQMFYIDTVTSCLILQVTFVI